MSDLIVPDKIPGFTVYGVQQVQYTVGGDAGQDYTSAVIRAAFKEATSIESACTGYSEVVKARQKKVNDLGDVLASLAKANAQLPSSPETGDKVTVENSSWIKSVCSNYDISLKWTDGNKMTYGDLQRANTDVQYQMEREDNSLQQDMVTLQSYLSKRDNAYSTAAKVVKKTLNAGASTIRNFGS